MAPESCEAVGRAGGGSGCRPEPLAGPAAAWIAGAPPAPRLRARRGGSGSAAPRRRALCLPRGGNVLAGGVEGGGNAVVRFPVGE